MSGLGTLGKVAWREIRERLRSRAYLIATGSTILIVLGLIVVPPLFSSDTQESTIGIVGNGNQVIVDTAVDLGNANDEPGDPPSIAIATLDYDDRETAVAAMETGEIEAVLVDGDELVVESTSGFGGSEIAGRLQRAAGAVRIESVVAEQGQSAVDIIEILTTDALEVTTLTGGDAEDDEGRTVIAYFGLLLLYMAVLLYGTWILTGVTEEKSNRVVEVLLSSVQPWQILGGKILGIGSLALAQLLGTLVVAFVALRVTEPFDLPDLEPLALVNLMVWFVLGFLIFAVLFGAAGSLVSRTEDANTIALPMTMTAVAGFFVSIVSLDDPSGPVAMVSTFIPVTAPFVVPVRAALDAISAWEYLLAVVIAIAAIGGLTVLGGRIYAGGILRFGSRVGWREAWRAARD